MALLYDLARIIRSKNAGPFEITFDILFDCQKTYSMVKQSGMITKERLSELFSVKEEDIHQLVFYDQALGLKITLAREPSSGSAGDRDVYGAQQHVPLYLLDIPI
ncbi:DUF4387 domain-containing protein [Metabacillus sp. GX 13764]|uniref:DUF4387 domain-containing protein n=1 Tax=Metabacillus kandeliae TaxID=2900151 RepID=UPI001E4FCAEF|nr:DUF4387 domain-containing protein [Metabacillus kandeliae]MCD7035655.1 DUF4387 domain-containing protein [Metabacillus kandeliae]